MCHCERFSFTFAVAAFVGLVRVWEITELKSSVKNWIFFLLCFERISWWKLVLKLDFSVSHQKFYVSEKKKSWVDAKGWRTRGEEIFSNHREDKLNYQRNGFSISSSRHQKCFRVGSDVEINNISSISAVQSESRSSPQSISMRFRFFLFHFLYISLKLVKSTQKKSCWSASSERKCLIVKNIDSMLETREWFD